MNALVVDDLAVMRKVMIGALERVNITDVDQAADGVEAVSATEAKDYDLILMDWKMPNMMGIDAIRRIRANGKTMPIIMVTATAEKELVMNALKAGAQDFVIKPFTPTTIINKISEVLARSSSCST